MSVAVNAWAKEQLVAHHRRQWYALAITCPVCDARPGAWCTFGNKRREMAGVHATRLPPRVRR